MARIADIIRDRTRDVRGPGKFEGESNWVQALWDASLEGMADDEAGHSETTGFCAGFILDKNDQKAHPDFAGVKAVTVCEDSQGFVSGGTFDTMKEYRRFFRDLGRESAGFDF